MKRLLPIVLVLLGCAQGRIAVVREASEIRFNFGTDREPAHVLGISVFEFDGEMRGETVCSLVRSTRFVVPEDMTTWVYGRPVGRASLYPVGCGPLTPGREYGVTVTDAGHRNYFRRFRLADDVRISTLD